jgi:DNA-binding Lrp family transcriptional regulator
MMSFNWLFIGDGRKTNVQQCMQQSYICPTNYLTWPDVSLNPEEHANDVDRFSEKLESFDREIIQALQKDARASYRDIARKIGIAVGTVHSRIKKLEENGVIRGFSVDLDYSKIGFDLTSLILLQAKGKHLREVENRLARLSNVCLVYDVTGDFDVAVVAKFKGTEEMDRFIKQVLTIDSVERTVTSIVLNRVKENFNMALEREHSA